MIDVTVPFETDDQAFDRVRQAKLDKYSELAEWLKNKYESSMPLSWEAWGAGAA